MPRYDNDPTKVVASFEVLPKDDYEFIVGEPSSFERTAAAGHQSYGVRFPLVVAEGAMQGKRFMHTCYEHSEGAQTMGKQFLMACLGYGKGRAEEQRFNKDMAGEDWSFDTDTKAVGDAWRKPVGKRVVGSLDIQISNSGDEQQQTKGWRVIGS